MFFYYYHLIINSIKRRTLMYLSMITPLIVASFFMAILVLYQYPLFEERPTLLWLTIVYIYLGGLLLFMIHQRLFWLIRYREFNLKKMVGASLKQIALQLMTESMVNSLIGFFLGLGLADITSRILNVYTNDLFYMSNLVTVKAFALLIILLITTSLSSTIFSLFWIYNHKPSMIEPYTRRKDKILYLLIFSLISIFIAISMASFLPIELILAQILDPGFNFSQYLLLLFPFAGAATIIYGLVGLMLMAIYIQVTRNRMFKLQLNRKKPKSGILIKLSLEYLAILIPGTILGFLLVIYYSEVLEVSEVLDSSVIIRDNILLLIMYLIPYLIFPLELNRIENSPAGKVDTRD